MDETTRHVRKHLFEGYLLEDLNSVVNKLDRTKIIQNGHCGYVAVQIILAGMECLGQISSGGLKDEKAFYYYYDHFFSKVDDRYNNEKLKRLFRNVLRNGTAHYFFTKAGIVITLNENQLRHLSLFNDGKNVNLNIAVSKLYEDFLKSYELFKPNWDKFSKGCHLIMDDINNGQKSVDSYVKSLEV